MRGMDQTRRPAAPPPILDMTPDGQFRDPAPPPPRAAWLDRVLAQVGGAALLLSALAGGFLLVALAVAFTVLLVPVALIAGLVGFGALWWRARRMRGRGGGPGGVRVVIIRR